MPGGSPQGPMSSATTNLPTNKRPTSDRPPWAALSAPHSR
jgi:hypothetical protein